MYLFAPEITRQRNPGVSVSLIVDWGASGDRIVIRKDGFGEKGRPEIPDDRRPCWPQRSSEFDEHRPLFFAISTSFAVS
jgi:hypothetical protein